MNAWRKYVALINDNSIHYTSRDDRIGEREIGCYGALKLCLSQSGLLNAGLCSGNGSLSHLMQLASSNSCVNDDKKQRNSRYNS